MNKGQIVLDKYALNIKEDVTHALLEDLGGSMSLDNDLSAMLISSDALTKAHIITREDCIMCGKAWANMAFNLLDNNIRMDWSFNDGDLVKAGQTLVKIEGNTRAILTAERSALNFMQLLSGTATTTYNYVQHLRNSKTQLLDTRKTIPTYRQAQKYAVTCGQGYNHRMGLYDAFLIKENHIAACGCISMAVQKAKQLAPNKLVEVEVENLKELEQAIAAGTDIIMLDNFSTEQIQTAVSINSGRCKLEVSGNITEQRLAELSNIGVDYISSGAITKHIKAIDLSLLII
ncbi:carboxylating nicotinate-nucleotide diphosphorylase [Glaciecola petra]|uniref:nicotinate-nucleotide diphosphorylase (carboxylating) n=1 Tax=Glaciecola petra TaxID=3075602 RepID=A0ABU2ZLL7_9ALTE|nr:carboxylating nicotinate-nucleotide diphosphorylase [Aestuariibacter sp. P117]MDT0593517.1 carboxylating nicotinate-nucleotide diphosphorylase [Aestuariibacter sp. P117]